jgi:hypothetical protein
LYQALWRDGIQLAKFAVDYYPPPKYTEEIYVLIQELEVLSCYRLHYDYYTPNDLTIAIRAGRRNVEQQKKWWWPWLPGEKKLLERHISKQIGSSSLSYRIDAAGRVYRDPLGTNHTGGKRKSRPEKAYIRGRDICIKKVMSKVEHTGRRHQGAVQGVINTPRRS